MKIELKEINKIDLKEDELLWVTFKEEYITDSVRQLREVIPKEWRDRVIFGTDRISLTKIKKSS